MFVVKNMLITFVANREQTIQVNTLSTTLLGLLLVSWLKEERARRITPAHLIFVTSRDHLYPNIDQWSKLAEKKGLLNHFSDEKRWPSIWDDMQPNYGNSKLLVMYAIEEISKRALGPDGE